MAEMSEAPASEDNIRQSDQSAATEFNPETMRKTKPGSKRLFLTLAVLFSFLTGFPFMLKTIEIHRAPLPFSDIDSLALSIERSPLLFPCKFQAVFLNLDHRTASTADELGFLINNKVQKLTSAKPPVCGTCLSNFTVGVTLDSSNSNCIYSENQEIVWKCGALSGHDFDERLEVRDFDDFLESLLDSKTSRVYTVVVVNRDDEVRAVVGKHRHAWVVGKLSEHEAADKVAEIFVDVFVNGGKKEGSIHGEFMPVGADGRVVLSFNLLNAEPRDWIYDWDFQELDDMLLSPIVQALTPIADISVESQVLYHTPKSSFARWDEKQGSYIFTIKDLPFFVNSNEWHLDTSIAAGGRSKILHFVVYIPSAEECPLQLQLPNGKLSATNGFISPMWGGVVVWNPPVCSKNSGMQPLRHRIRSEDIKKVFEVFMGQFRQLFGLSSDSLYLGATTTSKLLTSENGFTQWELDFISRQHTCFNLLQCGTTLGSLSRLVQSLPRMIIMDEIGKQVKLSLDAASSSLTNVSFGNYDASAVSSRQARSLAEDAFYHPSMMSLSYYSFEHCFAVYSPFFLPVALHVILAVMRELKRYKQENRKYVTWKGCST
ncbi:hypothetical protein DM860_012384 [Cuscuta australis]|uniref:GPI transamidase component PIG-S n=1 Tax=Cuscuta australis TaxID=267555 RepID=A0A328DTQ2_9ASTE|nr:hypothetical protein DM860_012384 [Cuscuta australis]